MSNILALYNQANYYLYRRPTNMRKSFDGLCGIIRNELDSQLNEGDIVIFLNRTRTLIRLLQHENGGFSLFYQRLDEGHFEVPKFMVMKRVLSSQPNNCCSCSGEFLCK